MKNGAGDDGWHHQQSWEKFQTWTRRAENRWKIYRREKAAWETLNKQNDIVSVAKLSRKDRSEHSGVAFIIWNH
jgi:hypothetical protein